MNADPDLDPDPQPWYTVISTGIRYWYIPNKSNDTGTCI